MGLKDSPTLCSQAFSYRHDLGSNWRCPTAHCIIEHTDKLFCVRIYFNTLVFNNSTMCKFFNTPLCKGDKHK